ncbi:hypothetical protein FPOAC1_012836 [Fusarium poae]|uniref:uncharacterized protein n=1 Tax=Fusarium poae TaxID=36050 RepID=UPI001CEADED8|nr:uncharacterized protein FPOAC1_014114 [Fusarium poae]XP_044700595.1 uncharacterized protein FPOAC1_014116 [Fusarium poae]XP_044704493.1 hypothetical protein FPOAC1_012836 [Fusarium poae]KAG8664090.1 hypothetical protein FPOAC1_014114 [Fusarium poae]KAG8664092.1 hypothetical protein FPOAC1_014116 [Fusarium poae]KAG8667993.1 hypothetical protein FPOAC1_012836 [Fusarium poae]
MNFAENKSGPRARSGVRPTKHPRRVYERGAKQPGLKGLPLRADSLVWRPMVPQRLSIVVRRPPRNGFTDRVLGMPALQQLGFGLVASSWVLWMAGRWLRLKLSIGR